LRRGDSDAELREKPHYLLYDAVNACWHHVSRVSQHPGEGIRNRDTKSAKRGGLKRVFIINVSQHARPGIETIRKMRISASPPIMPDNG